MGGIYLKSKSLNFTDYILQNINDFFVEKSNFQLIGKTGCGKTTLLIDLAKRLLDEKADYIPIYIPLPDVPWYDSVFRYIAENYFGDVNVSGARNSIIKMIEKYEHKYVVLLDDYNFVLDQENINKEIKCLSDLKNVIIVVATTTKSDFLYDFKTIELQDFSDEIVAEMLKSNNSVDNKIQSLVHQPFYMYEYLRDETISEQSVLYLVNAKIKMICRKYSADKVVSLSARFSLELLLPYLADRITLPTFMIDDILNVWDDFSCNYNEEIFAQYSELINNTITSKGLQGTLKYLIDEFLVKNNFLKKNRTDKVEKYSFENEIEKQCFTEIMQNTIGKYRKNISALVHSSCSYNLNYFENKMLVKTFADFINYYQVVIIMGVGGYGKTTLINSINDISKIVIDRRNRKEWAMIHSLLTDNNDEFKNADYVVVDNFRTLTEEDYRTVCKNIHNKKLIISCRNCEFLDSLGSNIAFIDCNKYKYDMNDIVKKSLNNRVNYDDMIQLIDNLPDYMKTPLFFKLIARIADNCEKITKLQLLCNNKNESESEACFINSFLDAYFENMLTSDEYELLILFSIIVRDMIYYEDKVKEFLKTEYVSVDINGKFAVRETGDNYYKKIKRLLNEKMFVDETDNKGMYLHSIFADYFMYYFYEKFTFEQKMSFLNSELLFSAIYCANAKLESGVALQYKDKISFLPYSYNLQRFVCRNVFEKIEVAERINEKKLISDMFNFVNSYTFLLVKSYSSLSEIREQIEIQRSLVKAMTSETVCSRWRGDNYYRNLAAFYNVLLKVQLVLFVYYPKEICFDTLLQSLETNKKACESINNAEWKRTRMGLHTHTASLLYYKLALLFDQIQETLNDEFQNARILLQKAYDMADASLDYGIDDVLSEYSKANEIGTKLDDAKIRYIFKKYDSSTYEIFYKQIVSNRAVFNEVRSCFATLELKCVILSIESYLGLNIFKDDCLTALRFTCNGFVENINFSSRNDDVMRFRQMLLLEIASGLHSDCELKQICEEVKEDIYATENKDDDMRFEFLKYLVIKDYVGKWDFSFFCNIFNFDAKYSVNSKYAKKFFYKMLLS